MIIFILYYKVKFLPITIKPLLAFVVVVKKRKKCFSQKNLKSLIPFSMCFQIDFLELFCTKENKKGVFFSLSRYNHNG